MDFDDWSISATLFSSMDKLWGPHTVNRFADDYNAKIRNFSSKFASPQTSQVDVFPVSWEHHSNWLVLPIKHKKACRASATLVVPIWRSALFWPLFFSRYSAFS